MKSKNIDEYENIKRILEQICTVLGESIDIDKIQIIRHSVPHKCEKLPENSMGIYMFKYKDRFLKIGKVNSKSGARFTSHHYNPTSTGSNLAKSILADEDFCKTHLLTEMNIKAWMKENLQRIDILLEDSLGVFVLNLLEACLHYKYKPIYEGYKSQKR